MRGLPMKTINILAWLATLIIIYPIHAMNVSKRPQDAQIISLNNAINTIQSLPNIDANKKKALEAVANLLKKRLNTAIGYAAFRMGAASGPDLKKERHAANDFLKYINKIQALTSIADVKKEFLILPMAQFLTELDVELDNLIKMNAIRTDRAEMIKEKLVDESKQIISSKSPIDPDIAIAALHTEKTNLIKPYRAFLIENEITRLTKITKTMWKLAEENKIISTIDAEMALANITAKINQLRVSAFEEKVFNLKQKINNIEKINNQLFEAAIIKKRNRDLQQLTILYEQTVESIKEKYEYQESEHLNELLQIAKDIFSELQRLLGNGKITFQGAQKILKDLLRSK